VPLLSDAPLVADVPWLLIQGGDDDVVPTAQLLQWIDALPQRPHLKLLEGAGHFFHGRLDDLKQAVLEAAAGADWVRTSNAVR
jgi:alpha/beta superfamily hydrolase